jgi:carboxyl-terminal processing protease
MSRWIKAAIITLSLAVLVYVGLGYMVMGQARPDDKSYRSLSVYSQVLQHIQQDYVEDPDMPLVTTGALRGLLESLDPQSSYLSPREYADYKAKLDSQPKGEPGIALTKRFGYVAVVAVLPDSPADRAGIRGGDIFESLAGFTTREMSLEQARVLLAGVPGSTVKGSVIRRGRGEPAEIEIVRGTSGNSKLVTDRIESEPATPDSAVAYLRIPAFPAGKAGEVRAQLAQFERQGLRRLVLDLRESAIGEISEGVAVAQLFLNAGTITVLRGQTVDRQEFLADASKVAWKYPLVVLTSNGTGGPAEIVAAAIAGNQRGQLVGTRTAGTASMQKLIPLEDGAAIVLTIANYFTPAGRSIPEEGVAPSVNVDGDDFRNDFYGTIPPRDQDKALRRALEIVRGRASDAPAKAAQKCERALPLAA